MASCNITKFANADKLRTLKFQNLIKLLDKFKDYLKGVHQFIYENATEKTFDFDTLAGILFDRLLEGDTDFYSAFGLIGAMGSASKYDILLDEISRIDGLREQVEEDMTAADLALLLYLENPKMLEDLDIKVTNSRRQSFTTVVCSHDTSDFFPTDEQLKKAEYLMNQAAVKHNRGNTVRIFTPALSGDELRIQIRKGEPFKRASAADREQDSKTIAYQPLSYDYIVLNRKTRVLRYSITKSNKWIETTWIYALGMGFFDDPAAFTTQRINDLDVVKTLSDKVCLCPEVPNIASITATKIKYTEGDTLDSQIEVKSSDIFRRMQFRKDKFAATITIVEMTFSIEFKDGKVVSVPLVNGNKAKYNYDQYGVDVDQWLTARGIIKTENAYQDDNTYEDVFVEGSEEQLERVAI
ncbi:MAG: hypothetical protein J6W00_01225 [Lentisphaeria bacterium]|nr:hypothetical protein [Lentisphaeria bacterium]